VSLSFTISELLVLGSWLMIIYAHIVSQVLAAGTHSLSGKNIDPKRAKPRGPEPVKKVFVGGLDPSTSEDEIRAYFGQYGTVTLSAVINLCIILSLSYVL